MKKTFYSRIFVSLHLLLCTAGGFSQENRLQKFILPGVSFSGLTTAMTQDAKGFMWFVTGGWGDVEPSQPGRERD